MLLSIIKNETTNEDYYINLENENNNETVSITHVSDKVVEPLPKKYALELLKTILSSKLNYLEDYNEYKVYLDEANNKRYFKNGEEDYQMLFKNNGEDATLYIKKIDKKTSPETKKLRIQYGAIVLLIIFDIPATVNLIKVIDMCIPYKVTTLADYCEELDINKIEELINSSTDLSEKEKEKFYNESLLNLVLEYSTTKNRNYSLTNKLTQMNIEQCYLDFQNPGQSGCYKVIPQNTMYVRDNIEIDSETYYDVLTHEYIHLLQTNSEYNYINDACAEIISNEYFESPIHSYKAAVTRTKVLMEIIGPEPILVCNFSEDMSYFEDSIKQYLSEEDSKHMLELLKANSKKVDDEDINDEIDELLAKMYKNKTGNDIKDDMMIKTIYNDDADERVYFNSSLENYNKDFHLISQQENIDKLDINDIVNSNIVEKYSYNIEETVMEEGKTSTSYTLTYTEDFNSIKLGNQNYINIHFKDGTIGYCSYDTENNTWGPVNHVKYVDICEPSIPKKFPNQHKEQIENQEVNKMFENEQEQTNTETKVI